MMMPDVSLSIDRMRGIGWIPREANMRCARLVLLITSMLMLAGCTVNPSTGKRQLILFDSAQMNAMGEQAVPEVLQEFGGEVESQVVRAYVDRVGRRLLEHIEPEYKDLAWEFYALDSDVINAFALPGGKVFITRGLMAKFDNEAQVAAVLGHEIGHVTGRHAAERLSNAFITEGLLSVIDEATDEELVNLGASVAAQGVMLKFSRGDELESDGQGLKYMVRAGYDPMAMIGVLEVLKEASQSGRPPEFLSTHPYPETRIEAMKREIKERYGDTQNNPEYKTYGTKYQQEVLPLLR
jgi:predicted Zn-dependent protease